MKNTDKDTTENTGKKITKHRFGIRYLIIILIIAVGVSSVAVSGVFAAFSTSITGKGYTPLATWGFDVTIDEKFPDDEGYIYNISLARYPNRDENSQLPEGYAAPGAAGYMPITINATKATVATIVSVTAEFDYTCEYITFTDNLGRPLKVKDGKIQYFYYFTATEIRKWTSNSGIGAWDIGFRWYWDSEDTQTAKDIFVTVTVQGKQMTSAIEKLNKTEVHFTDGFDITPASNFINVLYEDVSGDVTLDSINKDLWIDFHQHTIDGDFTISSGKALDLRIGTKRRETHSAGTITGKFTVDAPKSKLFYAKDLTEDTELDYND